MVVSVAINYIDRGSLSTAAPLLQADLAIPPARLGMLLSSFFWTYALLQIASGWLVDRYEVKCCLLYTSPSPRDRQKSRMPSSA